ncbi:hypothetical protein GGX14DRAFT_649665 [Mycena pura]|uniref:Dystroglycan-type cadherin-like domain-containing protein n=1 Tax=Mycena pura TaxID=153505 RepID=A0AAD6YNH3_9AGAR|nr:hypothetical protein GGX14DRAFT_649665 [Mycena pura]
MVLVAFLELHARRYGHDVGWLLWHPSAMVEVRQERERNSGIGYNTGLEASKNTKISRTLRVSRSDHAGYCTCPPFFIPMILSLFYVLVFVWTVSSSTISLVNDPVDQLPLIARVNQYYSWSFSPSTFRSTAGGLSYTAPSLPGWLFFDPSTRTFHGTPAAEDEGNPNIILVAHDSTSSASTEFPLCVTSYPSPTVNIPLAAQFYPTNPALSSVFTLSPNSAIATVNPALRIPPQWSFSIGFLSETFDAPHNLYYGALQADGSALPEWMEFNKKSLTLNGVVPHDIEWPSTISLCLIGSDQDGYTAKALPFDIVVSLHEVSQQQCLPTMNITQANPFNVSVLSPDDFVGLVVDGRDLEPTDIMSLLIDTSLVDWLNFDESNRMLSGNPPDDCAGKNYSLPLTVTAFNQSLRTILPVEIVPSFFSTSTLPPQVIGNDRTVNFDVAPYFANVTGGQSEGVDLSAAFDSPEGGSFLTFDPLRSLLSGTIPKNCSASHMGVTFIAYSQQTHSTSHASLTLFFPPASKQKAFTHPSNLSAAAHRKLIFALAIVFGVIGSVCALGVFFSAFRRCAKVKDTAKADEEGVKVWSDADKRWYGVAEEEKGYGFSMPRPAMDIENPFGPGAELVPPARGPPNYGGLGLGLRRFAERSGSDPISNISSPGVMRKGEFLTRIRQTVRNVSEKYGSRRKASAEHLVIGKPVLIVPASGHLPFHVQDSPSNPFDDSNVIRSYPGSTILTNSPSTSTGEHSIPRRRADFAPPRSPALAHVQGGLVRQLSSASLSSDEEAVVQVASKATSIRSGISQHQPTAPRPRLVPFTSATRVPVPRVPSLSVGDSPTRRVPSQTAMVMKEPFSNVARSPTADELSVGIHYVRALGGDHSDVRPDPSTHTVSTHFRSSFSSLESSHHGHAAAGSVMRTLVRTGEKFNFRVAVSMYLTSYKKMRKLEAKLMSGKPLPKFLQVDLNGNKHSDAVEFHGVPGGRDLGEYNVGVYTVDDGACVGRVVLEVVGTSR